MELDPSVAEEKALLSNSDPSAPAESALEVGKLVTAGDRADREEAVPSGKIPPAPSDNTFPQPAQFIPKFGHVERLCTDGCAPCQSTAATQPPWHACVMILANSTLHLFDMGSSDLSGGGLMDSLSLSSSEAIIEIVVERGIGSNISHFIIRPTAQEKRTTSNDEPKTGSLDSGSNKNSSETDAPEPSSSEATSGTGTSDSSVQPSRNEWIIRPAAAPADRPADVRRSCHEMSDTAEWLEALQPLTGGLRIRVESSIPVTGPPSSASSPAGAGTPASAVSANADGISTKPVTTSTSTNVTSSKTNLKKTSSASSSKLPGGSKAAVETVPSPAPTSPLILGADEVKENVRSQLFSSLRNGVKRRMTPAPPIPPESILLNDPRLASIEMLGQRPFLCCTSVGSEKKPAAEPLGNINFPTFSLFASPSLFSFATVVDSQGPSGPLDSPEWSRDASTLDLLTTVQPPNSPSLGSTRPSSVLAAGSAQSNMVGAASLLQRHHSDTDPLIAAAASFFGPTISAAGTADRAQRRQSALPLPLPRPHFAKVPLLSQQLPPPEHRHGHASMDDLGGGVFDSVASPGAVRVRASAAPSAVAAATAATTSFALNPHLPSPAAAFVAPDAPVVSWF